MVEKGEGFAGTTIRTHGQNTRGQDQGWEAGMPDVGG